MPETLLESELFGHVKGSFTGAYRDKPGKLEMADSGTIFLDEIGEMTLRMQGLLLRFLETGELQKVGADRGGGGSVNVRVDRGDQPQPADLIVAGTVPRGSVLPPQRHPPRRCRRCASAEDIPALVDHFLRGSAAATAPGRSTISPEALAGARRVLVARQRARAART